MAKVEVAAIICAQNRLFDLIESQTKRLASQTPQAGFTCTRAESRYNSFPHAFDNVEVTVHGPCNLTLDFESNRPTENSSRGVDCKVGVFRQRRHETAQKLEDYDFSACLDGRGGVSWAGPEGTAYTPDQLCSFAFQRLHEEVELCFQQPLQRGY